MNAPLIPVIKMHHAQMKLAPTIVFVMVDSLEMDILAKVYQ